MQRTNWKQFAQSPWPKFSAAFLILFTFYLLARDTHPPVSKYHDLLTNTNTSALMHQGTSRLVRILEANEKRYQFTIAEREKLILKSGGYDIPAFPPPFTALYVLWDFFIPAFTCPFPMYRVGVLADGGKWVCGLDRVLQNRPNPIVYSLNHQTSPYSSFEQDMLSRSPGCQIYGFDANATKAATAQWPWGDTAVVTDFKLLSRVHFNHFAVADLKAERYRSLHDVMRGFGHRWIDILKIDLEGSEFATLVSIIADTQDEPLPFGQLLLEVHIGWSEDMTTVDQFSKWFARLERAGLRPFYFEVSMLDVNTMRSEPAVVYWSFINIRGRHALVDDGLPEYP
ncbi:methyltransferase domain-containing protein [Mycena metata]|uniref:Methyltransferase domain-containing protein n=1 Tax=Mycena metata TaxID=1033252 RepID=A0AAD7J2L8_9AGAR|nr:methyltransferase domain-containing protein [Mycena metata]